MKTFRELLESGNIKNLPKELQSMEYKLSTYGDMATWNSVKCTYTKDNFFECSIISDKRKIFSQTLIVKDYNYFVVMNSPKDVLDYKGETSAGFRNIYDAINLMYRNASFVNSEDFQYSKDSRRGIDLKGLGN